MKRFVGIIGCGWLGRALAVELVAAGMRVAGTTTSKEKVVDLEGFGVEAVTARFSPELHGDVSILGEADAIVVAVPPGRDLDPVAQAEAIAGVIGETDARHVVQISTTSVYPSDGKRVAESDAIPDHRLRRIEAAYQSSDRVVTVLRCAGLFGPGRLILPFVLRAGVTVDEMARVNLVEQSDVMRAMLRVLDEPKGGEYNICADEHPTKGEFYRAIAKRAGLDVPPFEGKGETFKIVDNGKFKRTYAFEYEYPDPLSFPVDA